MPRRLWVRATDRTVGFMGRASWQEPGEAGGTSGRVHATGARCRQSAQPSSRERTNRYRGPVAAQQAQQASGCSRRVLISLAIVAILLVGGAAVAIGYPWLRIRAARDRVTSYCGDVQVGQSVDLSAMAKEAEARGFHTIGPIPQTGPGAPAPASPRAAARQKLMVIDGWVFARWVCEVTSDGGTVSAKRVSFLD